MVDLATEYCPDINREIIINEHPEKNKGNIAMDRAIFHLSEPGKDCDGNQRYLQCETPVSEEVSPKTSSSSWADEEEVFGTSKDVLIKRPEYPCLPRQTAHYAKILETDVGLPETTELSIFHLNMYPVAPAFLTWALTVTTRDVEALKKLFDPIVITKNGLIQRDGYEDARFESPMYISDPKLLDTTIIFSQTSDDMSRITSMFSKFRIDSREVVCRSIKRFALKQLYEQIEQNHLEKTGQEFFIRKKSLKPVKKEPRFKEKTVEKKAPEAPRGYMGGFAALMDY